MESRSIQHVPELVSGQGAFTRCVFVWSGGRDATRPVKTNDARGATEEEEKARDIELARKSISSVELARVPRVYTR